MQFFACYGLCLALSQHAAMGFLATILSTSTPMPPDAASPIPVLEVIKVYGKLAGPECYGKTAPKGSSCQVTLQDVEQKFGLNVLSQDEFRERLNQAEFQWPLKPYGVEKSESLSKTATMNKGAETKVFMDQLEERGLYDKRNPTGPLPTSLRPQLNRLLQKEGIDPSVSERAFRALGGDSGQLRPEEFRQIVDSSIDYYGFLELIGKESITWPY